MINRGDGSEQIAILEFGWTSDTRTKPACPELHLPPAYVRPKEMSK
jgi:hypothetical protein